MASPLGTNAAITGATLANGATPTGYVAAAAPTYAQGQSGPLSQAIQTIWSKEILFQAMPILRFEQFAVKKTELGVQPGLTINFMRYNNLTPPSQALTEGVRMDTVSLSASQFSITVAEQGQGVSVSELLLNASFDDVMASASRLLGRSMAMYLDVSARNTLYGTAGATLSGGLINAQYGYSNALTGANNPYYAGTKATTSGTRATAIASMTGAFNFSVNSAKDAVESLATLNIPRLGETYVCFVHPHQSRTLRDNPEWIEVTKYAGPGNFMLGEIGRLNDVVYIETTQVRQVATGAGANYTTDTSSAGVVSGNGTNDRYDAIMIGDNTFGHAIALPVELRDGGVLDFGREHALAWYAIWGFGIITNNAGVIISTN